MSDAARGALDIIDVMGGDSEVPGADIATTSARG